MGKGFQQKNTKGSVCVTFRRKRRISDAVKGGIICMFVLGQITPLYYFFSTTEKELKI